MKKLLLALIALSLVASVAFAGTPMTSQGDKALSFVVNGLGTFGVGSISAANFSGGAVNGTLYGAGGKYYIGKDMALRGVLSVQSNSETQKTPTGDNKDSRFGFALAPGMEWHMMTGQTVSPYWGLMVQFGMLSRTVTPAGGTETKYSGTQFGAGAMLGVEWFPWDAVSFNAEYQLGFMTTSSKTEAGGVSTDGPSYTDFGIQSWAVGINVYMGN